MTAQLQVSLNNYYNRVVNIDQPENRRKKGIVNDFLNYIAQDVASKDPMFSANLRQVGSGYQGTQVVGYSDFDVLIPLTIYAYCERWERAQSRVELKNINNRSVGSAIHSGEVRARLTQLVTDAIKRSQRWRGEATVHPGGGIPVVITLNCGMNQTIPIDLTPFIPIANVSGPGQVSLMKSPVVVSSANVGWPSAGQLEELRQKIGFFPAGSQWRVSIPEGHTVLIRDLDSAGTFRKRLFHILKALSYQEWSRSAHKVPSYFIAVAMFREMNNYPDDVHWTKNQYPERFKGVVDRLASACHNGVLEDFFLPGTNVLDAVQRNAGIDALKRFGGNINNLRTNPCATLDSL